MGICIHKSTKSQENWDLQQRIETPTLSYLPQREPRAEVKTSKDSPNRRWSLEMRVGLIKSKRETWRDRTLTNIERNINARGKWGLG